MHRYPTRFQKKIQKNMQPTEFERSYSYVESILRQWVCTTNVDEQMKHAVQLFQHLYSTPILLKHYIGFREVTWHKMNEIEQALLSKLHSLPSSLAENSIDDMEIRIRIAHLFDLMDLVRKEF